MRNVGSGIQHSLFLIQHLLLMILGVLQLELAIPHAMSLKDKRRAIRSVRDRIASRFNVSIAETDAQDEWRRAVYSVAMVGSDHAYVEGALNQIVNQVEAGGQADLRDFRIDFL